MNYKELFQSLSLQLGKKPPVQEIAIITGLKKRAIYTRSQRLEQNFSREELLKIEKALNVTLLDKNFVETIENEKTQNDSSVFAIPYWEGCSSCNDQLRREDFSDLKLDIELINSWNVKPEDLRIIAMPGEEMNGGEMPIRNKDLLVIDISRNNPYESGVFFATSHHCQRVYVRRLMETLNEKGQSVVFSTVDNEIYKKAIEKYWTKEMRTEADIKIIGRVITNATYTI